MIGPPLSHQEPSWRGKTLLYCGCWRSTDSKTFTKGEKMTQSVANTIWRIFSDLFPLVPDGSECCNAKMTINVFTFGMLIMLLSTSGIKADEFVNSAFGKEYKTLVTKEMIKHAPQWEKEAETPPVSPRKAIRVAERLTKKLIGERPGFQRRLESISLKPMEDGWIWLIRFEWIATNTNSTGLPDALSVFILMDGTAVQPQVEQVR